MTALYSPRWVVITSGYHTGPRAGGGGGMWKVIAITNGIREVRYSFHSRKEAVQFMDKYFDTMESFDTRYELVEP